MTADYKIRTIFVFLIFCSLYSIVLFNLYSIQIKQHNFFVDLAQKQYNVSVTTMPPRAEIYDRDMRPIALNQDNLSAFVLPKEIKNPKQLKAFVKQHFPQAFKRITRTDTHFVYLKRRLTPQELHLINNSGIEDIHLLKEPSRYYPNHALSHIVGITDIDNNGLFGIEQHYNEQLAGKPTTHSLERDARSGHFYFRKETKIAGHDGKPIRLTIDNDLQFLAYEELQATVEKFEAREGYALVLDPDTGEIIVMASYPACNPHDTETIDLQLTKNKCVTEVHEPGSVMKVFLALAALEENAVTADELIDCGNTKEGTVNGVKFSTVHADGVIPFSDVIAHSNNFGVAKVALRLGPKLYDHYQRLGFGQKTKLNWPGEQKGFVNAPHNWSRPSIISLSFGYEITCSLLQLALAFAIMATDGRPVQPTIIYDESRIVTPAKPIYSHEAIETMRDILEKTVASGTGKRAAIKGYKVLGKTGTARMVVDGQYSDHTIYTFAAIVEKGSYKRVIVTFVKDSTKKRIYADTVAAPLCEKITEQVLMHDKIL